MSLYPRVRGANSTPRKVKPCWLPLPPRARGKRYQRSQPWCGVPSTPACAGQTTRHSCPPDTHGLYPRVRGANLPTAGGPQKALPLPPRARGKPPWTCRTTAAPPSTPACAGQTVFLFPIRLPPPLYPRVRGANIIPPISQLAQMPLPPRARGKLTRHRSVINVAASTPACAGQTAPESSQCPAISLYPRVRGANCWRL